MATAPKMLTDEERTAANKAENKRIFDSIKADVVEPPKEEEKEPEVKEEEIVEPEKEVIEENKEQIEEHEKTEEELKEEIENAGTEKEKEKFQKRLNREVSKRKALETENADLKAKLAAKPDATLTEEEVESRSQTKAQRLAAEREFVTLSNKLFDDAAKIDKNFEKKVQDLADDIGPLPSMLVGIIGNRDQGARILTYFTDNHDEAEKYYRMSINQPIEAAAALAELNIKLRPVAKKVSKVPPPLDTVNPGGRSNSGPPREHMGQTTEDWIRTRAARLRAEGKG